VHGFTGLRAEISNGSFVLYVLESMTAGMHFGKVPVLFFVFGSRAGGNVFLEQNRS
jgi:hypothetical protein